MFWYASFDSGYMTMRRLRRMRISHVFNVKEGSDPCPLVSGSHLYVSWCRLMSTGAGFNGR